MSHPHPSTPREHAELLHGAGSARVAVATKGGGWREKAYPVAELAEVLPRYAGETDVYLSTQSFFGWRRISQLAACGALALDLDFYNVPALAGAHPRGVLEDARIALESAGQPDPSLAIFSGRGLYLMWLHGPVPRKALPRWNACQRALWEALQPLGADPRALDAARMLRLVGTRHSETGAFVETIRGPGETWEFDDLANEVLPYTREEIYDLRVQRAARDARRPKRRPSVPPQGYTVATLWEARLSDLQALRRLRYGVELPPGQRDNWLFITGVAMSWLCEPLVLRRELYALAHEVGGWDERESKARMQAVFSRAHAAARGETIEWEGREIDARYHFKNETIINRLHVTPSEERAMSTLISPDEQRRRDRERDERRRREAGAVTREQYLRSADERRTEAHRLRSEEGLSLRKIADRLDISKSQVQRLLSPPTPPAVPCPSLSRPAPLTRECPMSLPLYGGYAPPEGSQGAERPPSSGASDESPGEAEPQSESLYNGTDLGQPPVDDVGDTPVTDLREIVAMARARFGGTPVPPRDVAPDTEVPELTTSELSGLAAIRAYEAVYGLGSFAWTQAACKKMFYVGPAGARGAWPLPEELPRIRAAYDQERRAA